MSRLTPILLLVALLLGGCGGGGRETTADSSTEASTAPPTGSRDYVAAGDRICAEMVAEARQMGRRFQEFDNPGLPALTLTTRELIEPALPILERSGARFRALESGSESLELGSYTALYDPIVAVVRDRVEAGREGDATRAHALELQMLELGELQRGLAREAGLKSCDVDFIQAFGVAGAAG